MWMKAACVIVAFAIGACTGSSAETPEPIADDDVTVEPVAVGVAPTPAMLAAALTGDPVAMRDAAATFGGCNAPTSCAGFGSCGSWSAADYCDASCGPALCKCNPRDPNCDPEGLRGRDTYQSYRVCFNPAGESCTEWKQTTIAFCGC